MLIFHIIFMIVISLRFIAYIIDIPQITEEILTLTLLKKFGSEHFIGNVIFKWMFSELFNRQTNIQLSTILFLPLFIYIRVSYIAAPAISGDRAINAFILDNIFFPRCQCAKATLQIHEFPLKRFPPILHYILLFTDITPLYLCNSQSQKKPPRFI